MDKDKQKIIAALSLLKRLPPQKIHHNASALSNLIPDLADELLQRTDRPLEVDIDPETNKEYIKSEWNREGDSFRSFWTNKYYPPIENAIYPSSYLRQLEEKANSLFKEYATLYYQGGVHSCYFWNADGSSDNFACAFLMKKGVEQTQNIIKGTWDSINIVDIKIVQGKDSKKAVYSVSSSVILEMVVKQIEAGDVNISGSLQKNKQVDYKVDENDKYIDEFHLRNIGKLVEDVEGDLRHQLDAIYLGKTKESVFKTRSVDGTYGMEKGKQELAKQIMNLKM